MENAKSHHRSRNRLPETESNERLRIKVIEFPWTALSGLLSAPSFAEKATGKVAF
jgi:hypothetical protein